MTIQWIAVAVAICFAVGFIIRRIRRKCTDDSHCTGCDLAEHCARNKKK